MLIFPIPSVCENAEDKADEGDGRTDKSDSCISVSAIAMADTDMQLSDLSVRPSPSSALSSAFSHTEGMGNMSIRPTNHCIGKIKFL